MERAWESAGEPKAPSAPAAQSTNAPDRPTTSAATAPAGSLSQAAGSREDVLAVVDGEPIYRSAMLDLLMECHGEKMLEALILLTAARQKAASMSLTVTPADIKAAHEDALRRLATPFINPDQPPLDRGATERLLREFLTAKNISPREWDIRMEQRAIIAKIAAAEVARTPITEEMLRSRYEQDHGEKVQVRHIQLSSLAQVTRARALLAGKDFELVARQMSENELTASQGGLIPPFTRNDSTIPPLMREAAFNLRVGEVSTAIQELGHYQLIKVERRFPAGSVRFENADKGELRARVVDQLARQRAEDLEGELFRNAAVDVRDAKLGARFREKNRSSR